MQYQYDLNSGQVIIELNGDDAIIVGTGGKPLATGLVVAIPNVNTPYSGKYAVSDTVAFNNTAGFIFKEVGHTPTFAVINEQDILFSFEEIALP